MPNTKILNQVGDLADQATAKAEEYSGVLGQVQGFIVDHFGQNGLYAAYIALAVVILFVVTRVAKLTFSTIKFLVIPSLALALIGSFVLPMSFAATLPISVTICSLFLLFKG